MQPQLFALLLSFLCPVFAALPASAATYLAQPNSSTFAVFRMRADDGFSPPVVGSDVVIPRDAAAGGRIVASAVEGGIVTPAVRLDRVSVEMHPLNYTQSLGSGGFNYEVWFDEALFSAIGAPLAVHQLGQPSGSGLVIEDGNIHLRGRIQAMGEIVDFDVTHPVTARGLASTLVYSEIGSFSITKTGPNSSIGGNGWLSLATVQGVDFEILASTNLGSESFIAVIPEPTTALLMGLGLAGLSVRRR